MKEYLRKRITNKTWWVGTISNLIMLLAYLNIDLTSYIGKDWQTLLVLIFAMLTQLGVTVDTSTRGILDTATTVDIIKPETSGTIQPVNPNSVHAIGQTVDSTQIIKP